MRDISTLHMESNSTMKTSFITLALVAAIAAPVAAQSTAAPVKTKVSPSLAASAKISADSAKAIARATADYGEVSSADLELKGKRLIYEVKVLNKSKRATEVQIDAMTGEVIKDKKYGGLKATAVHHKENKKLLDAKRDSAKKTP